MKNNNIRGQIPRLFMCLFVMCAATVNTALAQDIADSLIVTVPKYFPPYYLIDENGQVGGYAVELAEEIAKASGLHFKYEPADDWAVSVQAVKEGKADIIANMGIAAGRADDFDFTSTTDTLKVGFIVDVKHGKAGKIEDLYGKRVGVVKRNVGYRLIKDDQRFEMVVVDDLPALLYDLLSGKVDAAVYPLPVFTYFAQIANVTERVKVLPTVLTEVERAMAVKKGNQELLERLQLGVSKVVDTERYHAIYRKWHEPPARFWSEARLIEVSIALAIISISIVIWRYISVMKLNRQLLRSIESQDKAEQASAAKTEFLSRMSHELRTPLNAILGFAQLLNYDKKNLSKSQQEDVQEILKGGSHLLDLVNEVLELSYIESGSYKVTIEAVDPAIIIEDIVSFMRTIAEERNIRLSCELGACEEILASKRGLKQVLVNLITNAIKYNRDGGEVIIECEHSPEGRQKIKIRDTGYGIDSKIRDRLFEPFERHEKFSEIEGTGIGLTVCKKLVEVMGGEIAYSTVPGEGSTFWVEFACATEAKNAAED